MLITLNEAIARYGAIEDGVWKNEIQWCGLLTVPQELSLKMINSLTKKPTQHIYCNIDMQPALLAAFNNILDRDLTDQVETFDGCYEVRDIRGVPGQVSNHAYALAIDINASSNKLGCKPSMSPELVKCFTDQMFIWGGGYKRMDGMHFAFANW